MVRVVISLTVSKINWFQDFRKELVISLSAGYLLEIEEVAPQLVIILRDLSMQLVRRNYSYLVQC